MYVCMYVREKELWPHGIVLFNYRSAKLFNVQRKSGRSTYADPPARKTIWLGFLIQNDIVQHGIEGGIGLAHIKQG